MTDEQLTLGDKVKGEIELPTLDLSKYIGQKATIESVTEHKGIKYPGYYIKVSSTVLDTLEMTRDGKTEEVPLRASRIFGLQEDKDKNIGWGKNTNLGLYLKKMGVDHYRKLEGKEIIVQTRTSKTDGKDYLSFN